MKRIFSIILACSVASAAHGSWFSQAGASAKSAAQTAANSTPVIIGIGILTGIGWSCSTASIPLLLLADKKILRPLADKINAYRAKLNNFNAKLNDRRDVIKVNKRDAKQEHELSGPVHQQQHDNTIMQQLDQLAPNAGTQNSDVFRHVINTFYPPKITSKQLFKKTKKGDVWRMDNGDSPTAQLVRTSQQQITREKSALDKEKRQLRASCSFWTNRSTGMALRGTAIALSTLSCCLYIDVLGRVLHGKSLHSSLETPKNQLFVLSLIGGTVMGGIYAFCTDLAPLGSPITYVQQYITAWRALIG